MAKRRFRWTGRQINAIKDSIAHWGRMREDHRCGDEPYCDDCACCKLGMVNDECTSVCPIRCYTGEGECDATPYYDARAAWFDAPDGDGEETIWRWAAAREINFLKKVLAAGTPRETTKKARRR